MLFNINKCINYKMYYLNNLIYRLQEIQYEFASY